MPRRSPFGSIVRHIPSWYAAEMQGGRVFQPATSGQLSYAELYNNANDGSVLVVWGVYGNATSTNEVVFETYYGKKATSSGFQGVLWPGQPPLAGLLGRHYQAACIGTEIGVFSTGLTLNAIWPYNWPCAVIPPGYSFSIHPSNTNSTLSAGLWWHNTAQM